MHNPYAIQVHCDGAMSYDKNQTGGNGFYIEFPESIDKESISVSIRNDKQGIHRLEMISILESIEKLLSIERNQPGILRKASSVEIYTDRYSVTDEKFLNPYRIKEWRNKRWKNHEGADIKNSDLIDKIDKARVKLSRIVGGRVSISYKKEKLNKTADKLSKIGKTVTNRGLKIINKKKRNVIKRLLGGSEINYPDLVSGKHICVRVYAWEFLKKEFEVCFEVTVGHFKGLVVKARVNEKQKTSLHRGHVYFIKIDRVHKHHVTLASFREKLAS